MPPKQNLNEASQKQLRKVDQIGKTLAARIAEHMPFENWADVEHLQGIGPVRVASLKKVFEIEHNAEHSHVSSSPQVDKTSRDETEDTTQRREYSWCVVS